MSIEIKPIDYKMTWPLRHEVMWPHEPLDYVKLQGDASAQHFGLFVEEKLVAVVSLFQTNQGMQFRKLATLAAYQRQGYGTTLLNFVFDTLSQKKTNKVWCNARKDKIAFYHKFGLKATSETFSKGGIDYVVMEKNGIDV